MWQADNSVKNSHTKFGENPLSFTQVIFQKQKYGWMSGRTHGCPIRKHNTLPLSYDRVKKEWHSETQVSKYSNMVLKTCFHKC